MINFIIYDKDRAFRKLYVSIIHKIMGNSYINYEITEIDKYNSKTLDIINKLVGKKIFILDIDMEGLSGLDLIKKIRDNNDWNSQMIVSTTHDKMEHVTLRSRLLILSFVYKYYECSKNIKDSLILALNILENDKSLNFQYNGEIHQIPYKDILFIERNINYDISIINTKSSKIEINKTINELEDILKDDNFLKTHRSCIVNVSNITSFELDSSIINFSKTKTNLITRDKKKELKDRLLGKDIVRS